MANCESCKILCVPYLCTIGGRSNLCSYCYSKAIRGELVTVGYTKGLLEQRFKELVTDPDKLEQFCGVCGFAACVHEILKRPDQAKNLFEAVFHHLEPQSYNNAFRLSDGTSVVIPFPAIMGKLSTVASALHSGYFVDWILCRGLTHALKVANRSLFDREVAFSDSFEMGDWHGDGHFAIQTDSLTYVAREICKLKVLWVLKHDYASTVKVKRESSPRLTQATASLDTTSDLSLRGQKMAREMVFLLDGSTAMFTAMHTGHIYAGWTESMRPDAEFTSRAGAGDYTDIDKPMELPFNHWVIIDAAEMTSDKNSIEVNMWTWHTRRKITYKIEHLTKYLREAVFVKL